MHNIVRTPLLNKKSLFSIPILFTIILFTFLSSILITPKEEQLLETNRHTDPFILSYYNINTNCCNKYFNTDILGIWYLDGYNNINISFTPNQNPLNVGTYEINSLNIDISTLNSFDKETYINRVANWDYVYIKEYYNMKLIDGKFGILLLNIDGNEKVFRRSISPNAKEGIFLGSSNCNPSS